MSENNDWMFIELYRSTSNQVLKYAVSKCGNIDDASDIMQKTYLSYYERVKKDAGAVKNPLKYLLKIAENELRKFYINKSTHANDIPLFSEDMEDREFESIEALLVQEIPEHTSLDTQEIWQYIKKLDPLTFKIFILYFYEDKKLADIAETLNITQSNVKHRLYRTIEKLKEQFNLQ